MIQDTQQGRFWLPDKPENPVPGTLRLRSEGRLELTTSHVENNFRDTFLPYLEKDHRPRTIAGVTTGGNIALIEATRLGRKTSVNTYLVETQQTWDCGYALQSKSYAPTPLEKNISSIEVNVQSLSGWTRDSRNLQLDPQNGHLSWPTKWEPHLHNWSSGDIGVKYSGRISGLDPNGSHHRAELTIDTAFLVHFHEPQHVEAVLDTVSALQSLVSIATGEPVAVERIQLTVIDGEKNHEALFHCRPVLYPVLPASKDTELFSFDEIEGTEGVAKWFSCMYGQPHVRNGLLIDRYHRPPFVTDVTQHRLLACEAYQRRVANNTRGQMQFKDTLPPLQNCGQAFLDWIGTWETWTTAIIKIRHNQTAHLQSYGWPSQDLASVDLVNRQLFVYLLIRILAECNFPTDLINLVADRASSAAIRHLP